VVAQVRTGQAGQARVASLGWQLGHASKVVAPLGGEVVVELKS
jgi:hypothetical protein